MKRRNNKRTRNPKANTDGVGGRKLPRGKNLSNAMKREKKRREARIAAEDLAKRQKDPTGW